MLGKFQDASLVGLRKVKRFFDLSKIDGEISSQSESDQ